MSAEKSFEELPQWCDAAACITTTEAAINSKNSSIKNLAKLAISPLVSLKKLVENRVYGIADYWDSLPKKEATADAEDIYMTEAFKKSSAQNLPEHQTPVNDI